MRKKLLCAVLTAAMVLSLTACGDKKPAETASASTPASKTETSADTNLSGVIDSGEVTQTNAECLIGNIPCNFPISTDGLTLNVMWRFTGVTANYAPEDVKVWQEYEKMTGIHVNFTDSSSDRKGMTQKALIGGEDYDLIVEADPSSESGYSVRLA